VFPPNPVFTHLQLLAGTNRYISIGGGIIEKNFGMYYHLQSPEGYDSFYIQRYGELLFSALNNGKYRSDVGRADADLGYSDTRENLVHNPYRAKLLSLLGVKYITQKLVDEKGKQIPISKDDTLFTPVWSDGIYAIYAYKNALARTFLVDSVLVRKSPQDILNALYNPTTNLEKTVILEKDPHLDTVGNDLQGHSEIEEYKNEKISIRATINKKSLLFLSDNYYPGWKAYVDGKETEMFRADYTFRAVVIPKGKHTIVFVYRPLSIIMGIMGSIVGFFILVGIVIAMQYNKKI
jgi:hypothetical protein